MPRKKLPLRTAVTIEIIALCTIAAYVLPGGEDLYRYYLPFAEGCFECGFNPWHASWILFPITLIPVRLLWAVVVLATLLGITWACRKLGTNPIPVLLAFPTMGMVWLGQIDVLVIVGLTLALVSPKWYLRSVGLLLASVKPQIAGIPMLILLWYETDWLRVLSIPALVMGVGLIVWGMDWPLQWLLSDPEPGLHVWRMASLFPYGLIAFTGVFLAAGKREKVLASLYASALGIPWFGTYSHTTFLTFNAPWWTVPISYAWLLAYPFLGATAIRFAWILPLVMWLILLWPHLSERWHRHASRSSQPPSVPEDRP